MLHCHYQWTQRLGGERRKGGGDKIHQIWWHGDVDNVFAFQLSSEKRRQNTTTFTLSLSLLWMKGSTMYTVSASNMSLCAQTLCPFTYQNDCPTIMWFNGKTHILLIRLHHSGRGAGFIVNGGKKEHNYPVSHLFAQIRQKNPQKAFNATVICRTETLENKCVQEM